jgi:hypothetical protein
MLDKLTKYRHGNPPAGGRACMVTVHGRGQKYLASVASVLFLLLAYVLRKFLV